MFYYNKSAFKIGICLPTSKFDEAKKFDFLELSLSEVMTKSEKEFYLLKNNIKKYKFSVPVMNCLFPRNLSIVGENLDLERVKNYLEEAVKRAHELGCKLLVVGSGYSRKYAAINGKAAALYDFKKVILILQNQAVSYGITVAIEPLCSLETNLLNTMKEVYEFIIDFKVPGVKMICDTYHLGQSTENFNNIEKYIDLIEHFHICAENRSIPAFLNKSLKSFFELINKLNYKKLISIEAILPKQGNLTIPNFIK